MESQASTQEADNHPQASAPKPSTDVDSGAAESSSVPPEVVATPAEPSAIGTPSQDEEEGVSDVESERSQEPQLSVLDISGMAARLLDSWKDLKVSSVN